MGTSNLAAGSGAALINEDSLMGTSSIEAEILAKKEHIERVGEWLSETDLSHPRWEEGALSYVKLQDDLIILECKLIMAQVEQREVIKRENRGVSIEAMAGNRQLQTMDPLHF